MTDHSAPRRTLHVNGTLVRSEPDTPEGRQAINKAALRYAETSEDVRVGRGEAQAGVPQSGRGLPEADRAAARDAARGEVAGSSPAPGRSASPRPTLAPCCEPQSYPGPSGIRRRHRFDCPQRPGQPIGALTATVRDISEGQLAREHRMQTRRTGLDEAISEHPASYVSAETHALIHVGENADDCLACSERRN